jgi:hypothetical protein
MLFLCGSCVARVQRYRRLATMCEIRVERIDSQYQNNTLVKCF